MRLSKIGEEIGAEVLAAVLCALRDFSLASSSSFSKRGKVDREVLVFCDEKNLLERKPVSVFEFERVFAADFFSVFFERSITWPRSWPPL